MDFLTHCLNRNYNGLRYYLSIYDPKFLLTFSNYKAIEIAFELKDSVMMKLFIENGGNFLISDGIMRFSCDIIATSYFNKITILNKYIEYLLAYYGNIPCCTDDGKITTTFEILKIYVSLHFSKEELKNRDYLPKISRDLLARYDNLYPKKFSCC